MLFLTHLHLYFASAVFFLPCQNFFLNQKVMNVLIQANCNVHQKFNRIEAQSKVSRISSVLSHKAFSEALLSKVDQVLDLVFIFNILLQYIITLSTLWFVIWFWPKPSASFSVFYWLPQLDIQYTPSYTASSHSSTTNDLGCVQHGIRSTQQKVCPEF